MAYLIISLDTELHWGYNLYPNNQFAKILRDNEKNAIESIYRFLNLFDKYRFNVTWAIVGRLFIDHPELIERIISSSNQHEIGYHSFSHPVFPDCSRRIAEDEILKGVALAKDFGLELKSFVFPENKIGHIDILKKYKFKIYRGYNLNGKNINKNLPIRAINYSFSKIIPPDVKAIRKDGIWELPSSMVFYDPQVRCTLGIRSFLGIKRSIQRDSIFHIFLHPEDLLRDPMLLITLESVLRFASKERERKNLEIITMGSLYDILEPDDEHYSIS